MTGTDREDAELEAMLESASADLAADGRARVEDDALVRRAVDRAMSPASTGGGRVPGRARRLRRAIFLVAAALIATSSALALVGRGGGHRQATRAPENASTAAPSAPARESSPVSETSSAPAPAVAAEAETTTTQAVPPTPRERLLPPATQPDAAALFSEANAARRGGDTATAIKRYALLQQRFPRSQEAALSRVALGRLYLDRLGDPGRALAQFDGYLAAAGNDVLREEAMVGRALALQRLGRRDEERAAWQALLTAYPGSLSSDRAGERLRELR